MPPRFRRKKRTFKKYIKKRTGARAQSKQILSISNKLSKLTMQNFARIRTSWQRDKISMLPTTVGNRIYICPIPYSPCDPLGTGGTPNGWNDNMGGNTAGPYAKKFIFGHPQSALNSNLAYHTGGILKYQFITTEPDFQQIGVYLIRPNKSMADQLVLDRKFKTGTIPGSQCELTLDLDFIVHTGAGALTANQTYFGSEFNKKYWDVLYHRELGFTHPGAQGFAQNANPVNASPLNNAIIHNGTIKIPAGGVLKNSSIEPQQTQNPSASWTEMGYLDQINERSCYLVLIQNGVPSTGPPGGLTNMGGFIVNDYYKAVV